MKNKLTMLAASTGALLVTGLLCQTVQANQITGTVDMGGAITLNSTSLATATAATSIGPSFVTGGSGTYLSASPFLEPVTWMTPLSFAVGNYTGGNPLWSFTSGATSYTFSLASISSYVVTSGDDTATLSGQGTLNVTGFTATPGNFTLTIDDSAGGTGGVATFGFGASDTAKSVPDGGLTVALLGGSLLGLQAVRRKLTR